MSCLEDTKLGVRARSSVARWDDQDLLIHIEESIENGDFEVMEHRIVVIDEHIIAQFNDGTGWWTGSKASNNDENDFAIWPFSESNMRKAQNLFMVGSCPVLRTDKKPIERNGGYCVDESDITPKPYNQALRMITRSL